MEIPNIDINHDGEVDIKDIKEISNLLPQLDNKDKQEFIIKVGRELIDNNSLISKFENLLLKEIGNGNENPELVDFYEWLFKHEKKDTNKAIKENYGENLSEDFIKTIEHFREKKIGLLSNGHIDVNFLQEIGETQEEFLSNLKILYSFLKYDFQINFLHKYNININIILNNIKLLQKNGFNDYELVKGLDYENNELTESSIIFLKKGFSGKSVNQLELYGITPQEVETLISGRKEVFDFFYNLNNPGKKTGIDFIIQYFFGDGDKSGDKSGNKIEIDYIIQLAKSDFDPDDYIGHENIFMENIKNITILINRAKIGINNLKPTDITFYFENFKPIKYFKDIEKIHKNIKGDVTLLYEYIEQGLNISDIIQKINKKHESGNDKLNSKKSAKEYVDLLGDEGKYLLEDKKNIKHINMFLKEYIKPENIIDFLKYKFSAFDLYDLGEDKTWITKDGYIKKEDRIKLINALKKNGNYKNIYETKYLIKNFGKEIISYGYDKNMSEGFSFDNKKDNEKKQENYKRFTDEYGSKIKIDEYSLLREYGFDDKRIGILANDYFENFLNKKDQLNGIIQELAKIENIQLIIILLVIHKNRKITIGKQKFKLYGNLQFLTGLAKYINKNPGINLDDVDNYGDIIDQYEKSLNEFIDAGKSVEKIYFVGSNHYYGEDDGNFIYKDIKMLEGLYSGANILNYSTGIGRGNDIEKSADMLKILENDLIENSNQDFMLYVSVHGDSKGNGYTAKGGFSKKDFEKIEQLSDKYSNLKVVVDSCNNGYKFGDNIKGRIVSSSGEYSSMSSYANAKNEAGQLGIDGFKKGDLNKDGELNFREIEIYAQLKYQRGIVNNNIFEKYFSTTYRDKTGKKVEISKGVAEEIMK